MISICAHGWRCFILDFMASMLPIRPHESARQLARRMREKLTLPALIARAPTLASAVLGLALVTQAAAIALSLSGEVSAGFVARAAATTRPKLRARHGMLHVDITAAHLFGIAPQMTATRASVVSRSPLVLTGIIATADPHDGFAIIGTSATSARAIYVGSEAEPGTVLTEVHPLWVILQRGGERLTLRLPRKDLMAAAGAGARQLEGSLPAPEAESDEENPGGAFELPEPLPKPSIPDGAVVVRAFDLLPTSVDGEQGMRISGTGLNKKVLASLGLVGGDVITQVNGTPVDAGSGPHIMNAIQSGDVTLTVVKDGQASSVTLDPTSVANAATLYRQADPDY